MLLMAKKSPQQRSQPARLPAGKKRPNRSSVPLHVGIPPELRAALDSVCKKTRRPLTTEVVMALEKHCESEGCWPPPPAQGK